MKNDNASIEKSKPGYSKPIIGGTIILLAVAGYLFYNKSTNITPDYNNYLEYINQGDSLVKINKFPEAKKSYQKSLAYNTRDSAVTKKIIKLDSAAQLIKTKKFAEAKKMFQVVLNIRASPALSQFALSKAGINNNPPIKISIRWKGETLEITISGGVPFSNENKPYTIEGVDCLNCVQWKKDSSNRDNYIASVTGTKIKANKIKLKDKIGQFSYGDIPKRQINATPITVSKTNINPIRPADKTEAASKTFSQFVKSGDSLFSYAKYPEAKNEYLAALSTHPGDKTVKNKIINCDNKINEQTILAAKSIPRVTVSGGNFIMGTEKGNIEESPEHQVNIKSFSMGKTEVTVRQYKSFCSFTGRTMPPTPAYGWIDDYPVVNVTWDEAKAYCDWIGGRLPTEAEWEYAARAGSNTTYSGSNQVERVAVYKGNSGNKPGPVGKKSSNPFTLSDMTGNVSEWCADWFGRNQYAESELSDPKGPAKGLEKVVRGGAYSSDVNSTQDGNQLKITYRNSETPSARKSYIGFRVAWSN